MPKYTEIVLRSNIKGFVNWSETFLFSKTTTVTICKCKENAMVLTLGGRDACRVDGTERSAPACSSKQRGKPD